ncbi:hypothetical protein [Thalassospira xiamenensis]|uniref:Uncharacterized protein n=1 Tax=Thalassospira xiamenensis TaxID=220697 RepID=A0A285TGS0_9PROT|nr:hypothetical protein [Thalassospira xiamenensis]SOC21424.1 hypothetical protein SAMN05428964_103400 [Thalassospira xiamenensis]
MSISNFMDQPAIRDAFKQYTGKISLPFNLQEQELLAPPTSEYSSAVGIAFDYLVRFRLTRDVMQNLPSSPVVVHEEQWVAENAVQMMPDIPQYARHYDKWFNWITAARRLFNDYINGNENDIARVVKCCQYLGNMDMLARRGEFNPFFKARDCIQDELLTLNANFDPVRLFNPKAEVVLNPAMVAGPLVEGADGDLFIDDTLYEMKTTRKLGYSSATLREMVGLKILSDIEGIYVADRQRITPKIDKFAVYFARFDALATWHIDEIFPDGGYQKFAEVCWKHLPSTEQSISPSL